MGNNIKSRIDKLEERTIKSGIGCDIAHIYQNYSETEDQAQSRAMKEGVLSADFDDEYNWLVFFVSAKPRSNIPNEITID